MAGFQLPKQFFHEKHYISRDNSVRFAATSSMRETLVATMQETENETT